MSLRVGYVNVNGLQEGPWRTLITLLHTTYDFLFVAEHWFIDHRRRMNDAHVVATSTEDPSYRRSHKRGGIYLLATKRARGMVHHLHTDEHSITVATSHHRITGVYYPPGTMDDAAVRSHLHGLDRSDVVMGDINTRFRDDQCQQGDPGPPDRLQVVTDWALHADWAWCRPEYETPGPLQRLLSQGVQLQHQLTVDHCFVRRPLSPRATLRLIQNTSIGLETDHQTTLHLHLLSPTPPPPDDHVDPIRFHLRKLDRPDIVDRLQHRVRQLLHQTRAYLHRTDLTVDDLDRELTSRLIQATTEVCGRYRPSQKRQSPDTTLDATRRANTHHSAVRLFKHALRNSPANDAIRPVDGNTDVMEEMTDRFRRRFDGATHSRPDILHDRDAQDTMLPPTEESVEAEILSQSIDKSCGSDGIHVRLLKVLLDTPVLSWLTTLYQLCVRTGTTPRRWNHTTIHFLVKDPSQPKTADNLRPITIICIFRKIFERLLLPAFHGDWAALDDAQAGFRGGYSTLTNVAIVHHALSSGARPIAVFLDIKAAFDRVSHGLLDAILRDRGAPPVLRRLVRSLMMTSMYSRLLVNDMVSEPIDRTCGILQGSPLSPILFNLFIDGLLRLLNRDGESIPRCLFYADDGALLTRSHAEAQLLLQVCDDWIRAHDLEFNVAKCGVVSRLPLNDLLLAGQIIPPRSSYTYLGFPIGPLGIDFVEHLHRRVAAAVRLSQAVSFTSDAWSVADRLRVYRIFLAPMFEYGAPLVSAWLQQSHRRYEELQPARQQWQRLIYWIGHASQSRAGASANLLGLLPIRERFQQLRTQYQRILHALPVRNPLKALIYSETACTRWLRSFQYDAEYDAFHRAYDGQTDLYSALIKHLRQWKQHWIEKDAKRRSLTALIPMTSRITKTPHMADITLTAPSNAQSTLFRYRQGMFACRRTCVCEETFTRGHESCDHLPQPIRLTADEIIEKNEEMAHFDGVSKYTDVDYLLNHGKLHEAWTILSAVDVALKVAYRDRKWKEAGCDTIPG